MVWLGFGWLGLAGLGLDSQQDTLGLLIALGLELGCVLAGRV